MKSYFDLADSYYKAFYSNSAYIKITDIRCISALVFGLAFLYQLVFVMRGIGGEFSLIRFFWLAGFELAFLFSLGFVAHHRQSEIVKKFNNSASLNLKSLHEVKQRKLENMLGCSRNQFISEASELDKILNLNAKYKSQLSLSVQSIADWIYSFDSRARVITLLVFLASSILLLTVREELTISSVYEFYGDATVNQILLVFFFFVAILAMTIASLSFAFRFLVQILSLLAWKFNGHSDGNLYAVKYLIRDLIKYHAHQPKNCEPKRRNALLL